jgi:hypothetical protein
MSTITVSTQLSVRTCPDCGGVYAIAQQFLNEAYRLGDFRKMWACPYCYAKRGYGEGQTQKLEKQLAAAQREKAWYEERSRSLRQERDHLSKSRDGLRGALVKVKKRVAHGICPCCKRSFQDLRRHMESKHPSFGQPESAS